MSVDNILKSWQKKSFKPVYWLEGEEDYYIDQLIGFAEHQLIPAEEAAFNLTVFYGKDADWASVVNACRRYPMFAERQVVLLKEAQHMKDIDKLEAYFEQPLSSTVLIIAYKGKTFDKRTKFYKVISKQAEMFLSKKPQEEHVKDWIIRHAESRGLSISTHAATLLEGHVGNDLSRIVNEIDKLTVNLSGRKEITEDDIEKYIGISKEFNVFELNAAVAARDLAKALTIIQYFHSNPKAAPIQAAIPAMYSSLSKAYVACSLADKSDRSLSAIFFHNPVATKTGKNFLKNYGPAGIDHCIMLLHQYNLKGVGVNDSNTESAELMKEMVAKMILG